MIAITNIDLSIILIMLFIGLIGGWMVRRAAANSKAKAYAEYVEECKKFKKQPMDYVSWERLEAATTRTYIDDDEWD